MIQAKTQVGKCPRCIKGLVTHEDIKEAPSCFNCGWFETNYVQPKQKRKRNSLMGGMSVQLRYIGFASHMMDQIVSVRLVRDPLAQAGVSTIPTCLWDGKDMKVFPKTGGAKDRNERTYRCTAHHHIILLNSTNGELRGWM